MGGATVSGGGRDSAATPGGSSSSSSSSSGGGATGGGPGPRHRRLKIWVSFSSEKSLVGLLCPALLLLICGRKISWPFLTSQTNAALQLVLCTFRPKRSNSQVPRLVQSSRPVSPEYESAVQWKKLKRLNDEVHEVSCEGKLRIHAGVSLIAGTDPVGRGGGSEHHAPTEENPAN